MRRQARSELRRGDQDKRRCTEHNTGDRPAAIGRRHGQPSFAANATLGPGTITTRAYDIPKAAIDAK
jgi:hypothetical protein